MLCSFHIFLVLLFDDTTLLRYVGIQAQASLGRKPILSFSEQTTIASDDPGSVFQSSIFLGELLRRLDRVSVSSLILVLPPLPPFLGKRISRTGGSLPSSNPVCRRLRFAVPRPCGSYTLIFVEQNRVNNAEFTFTMIVCV